MFSPRGEGEAGVVLEDRGRLVPELVPVHPFRLEAAVVQLAGGGAEQPQQDLDEGGLAGAVGADQGDALAGPDGEGDLLEGGAVRLGVPEAEAAGGDGYPGEAADVIYPRRLFRAEVQVDEEVGDVEQAGRTGSSCC